MELYFERWGDTGPPVLILHGLFGSSRNWRSVSKRLAEKCRVYAVDQRNHGKSTHANEFDYSALADDVLERLPKNIVTRALGMNVQLRVSLRSHRVVADDKYLLCSDGLSNLVSAEEIADTLDLGEPPEQLVRRFIAMANAAGGHDNISALVIECHGGYERARPADSVPPGESRGERLSAPEVMILGIEELDGADPERTPGLVQQLGALFGPKGS